MNKAKNEAKEIAILKKEACMATSFKELSNVTQIPYTRILYIMGHHPIIKSKLQAIFQINRMKGANGGTTSANGGTTDVNSGTTGANGITTSANGGTTSANGGTTGANSSTTGANSDTNSSTTGANSSTNSTKINVASTNSSATKAYVIDPSVCGSYGFVIALHRKIMTEGAKLFITQSHYNELKKLANEFSFAGGDAHYLINLKGGYTVSQAKSLYDLASILTKDYNKNDIKVMTADQDTADEARKHGFNVDFYYKLYDENLPVGKQVFLGKKNEEYTYILERDGEVLYNGCTKLKEGDILYSFKEHNAEFVGVYKYTFGKEKYGVKYAKTRIKPGQKVARQFLKAYLAYSNC